MEGGSKTRLLFILNRTSGTHKRDWQEEIRNYFTKFPAEIKLFELPDACSQEDLKAMIISFNPHRVIAVGGDGTVNLVAKCLLNSGMPLGILPAGSANGFAKEFNVPDDPVEALRVAVQGKTRKTHALKINDTISIHLSDIGFNAYVVKKFGYYRKRGMWSYIKAAWKVTWNQPRLRVDLTIDNKKFRRFGIMIVIANGTKYGTGGVINPDGKLDDDLFEVIVVKRVSFLQSFRMLVLHKPYDPRYTETFQTRSLILESRYAAHFQVDGEYLGKIKRVNAEIIPGALDIITPPEGQL